jgi:hypothetical protein
MNALSKVFRGSERIGFLPTVVCALALLVGGAVLARVAATASILWQLPALGLAVEFGLFIFVGAGALVSLWLIAHHITYRRRGYRVRWTSGNQWLYEERVSSTEARSMPCVRENVAKGYPAASDVRILGEASWDFKAPVWARGRRVEITKRIAECFGGNQGAKVRFLDA